MSGISVLLADDTPDIRMLLRVILKTDGRFDVVGEAGDGREAVAMATALRPDAVILDLAMPVMDGLQALPRIIDASPGSKVVVLSGFNAGQMRDEVLALGASAYLEKGAAHDRLVSVLVDLCPARDSAPTELLPIEERMPAVSAEPAVAVEELLDQYVSVLTHELRTPLTAIHGFASALRQAVEAMDSESVATCAEAIENNARALAGLVGSLGDAHAVWTGNLLVDPEEVDLGALVRETVGALSCITDPHPTDVSVSVSGSVVTSADPVRIRQVLTNLVSNAAKFSPPEAGIDIRVAAGAGHVEVSVQDRGTGIPAGREAELFQKFSRLGSTTKGSGLGLFVSRGIARAHGGDLVFERPEDGGSRFVMRVPIQTPGSTATNGESVSSSAFATSSSK